MEIVINDMSEWVVVKFIAEHNHPLSTMLSKSRLHRPPSTIDRTNAVHRLVCSLNNERIGPSNIARSIMQPIDGRIKYHHTSVLRDC